MKSPTNGIESIIRDENKPMILYKEPLNPEGTLFKYEIKIYFGNQYNETTKQLQSTDGIYSSMPTIYEKESDTFHYMYPNDARLQGLTYSTSMYCDICIVYRILDEEKSIYKNFPRVPIGTIPIMLHSSSCILQGLDKIKLRELGECPYDQGGYFIINGKEKVILSQESKVNDILYIYDSYEENVELLATIKSVSTEGFNPTYDEIKLVRENISEKVFKPITNLD